MTPIPEGFPISLRSWPAKGDDTTNNALPSIVQRIINERGGFRDITEESLAQEIAEAEAGTQDASSDDDDDEPEQDPDRMKDLNEAKGKMLKQLEYV